MEDILVVGANTRPLACSLKRLGYNIHSVDYFGSMDLKPCVTIYKSVLSQKPDESCGFFAQKFDPNFLVDIASELIDDVDSIICCSGSSPSNFPKHKILGNRDIESVENKYKLYKRLEKKFEGVFKLPETHLVSDLYDAHEIVDVSEGKKFLLKPLKGSGGIGIRKIDDIDPDIEMREGILQEIIVGQDLSASVLSSGDEAKTILTSNQIIGKKWLGQLEPYGYCGNMAPYIKNSKSRSSSNKYPVKEVAEELIKELKLIGSNGVDMIIKDNDIYVIEVNPRLQGTFEVAEASLGINMAEAHISACCDNLIPVDAPQKFAAKMILFARERSRILNLDIQGVHDIPAPNVIIEQGEPVATILKAGMVLEDTLYSAKKIVKEVYKNLIPNP
jgi:uncharacterized protein